MADLKRISELTKSDVNDLTEFVLVDKSETKTKNVTTSHLKSYLTNSATKGPKGPKGSDGIQGPQGEQGLAGPDGNDGAKGDPGPKGDKGKTGPKGDKGKTGPKGLKGHAGTPVMTGSLHAGPKGDPGERGEDPVSTTVMPQDGERGSVGDGGVDAPAQGQKGPKGLKGNKGPTGFQGERGPDGSPFKGSKGLKGFKGKPGGAGDPGPKGFVGSKGVTTTGPKGLKGLKGVTGNSNDVTFGAYHDLYQDNYRTGFCFTDGSTIPYYSNDRLTKWGSGMLTPCVNGNRAVKTTHNKSWGGGLRATVPVDGKKKYWAQVTVVPERSDCHFMIGLTTNTNWSGYGHIEYAFYFLGVTGNAPRVLSAYESSKRVRTFSQYSVGEQYRIFWDGVNHKIHYYMGTTRVRTTDAPKSWKSKNIYFSSCFYNAPSQTPAFNSAPMVASQTRYITFRGQ